METARKIIFLFLSVVLILIIVMGLWSIGNFFSKKPYTFNTSSQTVIKQIQSLNRLETASFTIEKIIDAHTNGNAFQQFLFGDKLLLIAEGKVIAGFDLSQVKSSDVHVNGTTLQVTLPKPEILTTTLDNQNTRVYDRTTGLLSKGQPDLESQARESAVETIRQAACQGNILDEASKNARNQLTVLFSSLGFTSVTIEIPAASC
jgi:hypothetical protein